MQALWTQPSNGLRFRTFCVLFAVGSWVHLTLPDAMDDLRWWPANVTYAAGAAVVLWRGALIGWVLSGIGLLVPLLFFEDQLTQSAFLLACSVAAIGSWWGCGDRALRMNTTLPATVAGLTLATYTLASFHKLNAGFFDREVSCATGGLHLLAANWSLSPVSNAESLAAPLFLFAEVTLVALWVWRPRFALPLAFALHIPLTIVFAPSFAFVMLGGWLCLFDEEQLQELFVVLRKNVGWIMGIGTALGAGSFALYMREHWVVYPWWSIREGILWVGLVAALIAVRHLPLRRPRRKRPPRVGLLVTVIATFVVFGLTPYSGLQFHHAGAMLSNLRVDQGCWNHWIVPEVVRLSDPYVRIDRATVLAPGGRILEERLRTTLWNRRSLARATTLWCAQGANQLQVDARYEGAARTVANLCETPFPFGRPWFAGMRTHQENSTRDCRQLCVH